MMFAPSSPVGRWLHWLFEASLLFKGLLAFGETMSGLGLVLTPNHAILSLVSWMTSHELAQDPGEDMAQWFQNITDTFPIATQQFYAIYLLAHGALKFTMVLMLNRKVLWAYPAAMVVLGGFVLYQLFEFVAHGSTILLGLSALDSIMIVLVWREWGILKLVKAAA
jgi:uncharacterized membrane protein